MNGLFKLMTVGSFLIVFFIGINQVEAKGTDDVTVEIDFGDKATKQSHLVNWEKDLSALEALMHVTEVSTHAVGQYVFVKSIDKVEGIPTKHVWYYKINGKSPGKLAISQKLKKGDVVTWIYKQDVCSKKKCK